MASTASEDAIAELAASLSVEDVPVKLRCATCSLIAYNALRLPCCEQNICESCHKELEDVCQVCHHEPLDKALCTPNKSLRTTTKVFLKRKLLEREKEEKKRGLEPAADHTKETPQEIPAAGTVSNAPALEGEHIPAAQTPVSAALASAQALDDPHAVSSADAARAVETKLEDGKGPSETEGGTLPKTEGPLRDEEANAERQDGHHVQRAQGQTQSTINQPLGFNQMNGMSNMGGMPIDMSAMMAIGAMPNMMGMGMDPMMMNAMASSMFGGFGGPNMGMGGMNMGMGQSPFGGPWMSGQDSYNGNAQGNAPFGNQTGFNMPSHQGNFNQMNQHYPYNDFQNGYGRQGSYGRGGRGRGRGGGYRGGYGYGYQTQGPMNQGNYHYGNNNASNSHRPQHQETSHWGSKSPQHIGTEGINGQAGHQQAENTLDEKDVDNANDPAAEVQAGQSEERTDAVEETTAVDNGATASGDNDVDMDKPMPIQSFVSDDAPNRNLLQAHNTAPMSPGDGTAAPTQGSHFAEPRAIGVPGAPTGPRALREGLPNTGRSGLAYSRPSNIQASVPEGPSRVSRSPTPVQGTEQTTRPLSLSPHASRSRSRSPSIERLGRRRSYRNRSRSRSNQRHRDQYSDGHEQGSNDQTHYGDQEYEPERRDSYRHQRARNTDENAAGSHSQGKESYERDSPELQDRYGRGHDRVDDRDHGRERHRDDEYSRDGDDARYHDRRSRSPTRRKNSPTLKEPEREGDLRKRRNRENDYEEDRGNGDGRHRHERHRQKRSRRHRSSSRDRRARQEPSGREARKGDTSIMPSHSSADRRGSSTMHADDHPPTGPRDSGRSRGNDRHRSRHHKRDSGGGGGQQRAYVPKTSEKDPNTLEREARDRERLMKEMQRRATFDDGRGQSGKDRHRSSAQYEDEAQAGPRSDRRGRRRR